MLKKPLEEFKNYLKAEPNIFQFSNKVMLTEILNKYTLLYISENIKDEQKKYIFQNIKESNLIIVDCYKGDLSEHGNLSFIIGFKRMVLIIDKSQFIFLQSILSAALKIVIYFFPKVKYTFDNNIRINYTELDTFYEEKFFYEEISSFNKEIVIKRPKGCIFNDIINSIRRCISGYLIKQGYSKLKYNRISNFNINEKIITKKFSQNDFIILRTIGFGSIHQIDLSYHIKDEQLYAIKCVRILNNENKKLIDRETKNYAEIFHPLLPKFYGTVKINGFDSQVIEFINGRTLNNIDQIQLSENDKPIIIYQLLLIIKYFHCHGIVYRDLKPDNVMIDQNKTVVLIDFDRLINPSGGEKPTLDIGTNYMDPRVNEGHISCENDIYSLGQMIYFVFNEKHPDSNIQNNVKIDCFNNNLQLISIYQDCTNQSADKRPNIASLIFYFYHIFSRCIYNFFKNNLPLFNYTKSIEDEFINNSMSNTCTKVKRYFDTLENTEKQYNLGLTFYNGENIYRDISKAIHCFTLAANQNHSAAQYYLGIIYYEGKYIVQDIKRSIYYFTLAANQNHSDSQFYLGYIYYKGEKILSDIRKSIYYFTLAANQNQSAAQYYLGYIYYKGDKISCDINKSIHYFTLAANQNHSAAQYYLGYIYYKGKYIVQDINKSIHYFTLAANQNQSAAQYYLGYIYTKGIFVEKNMIKGIYYFIQSSSNNDIDSHFAMGYFYYEGKYVEQDMKKSIHHYKEASSFNNQYAKNNLGIIYKKGILNKISPEIGYAIEYFEEAIRQKDDLLAKYNLSHIYIYEYFSKEGLDKSIELLIESAKESFSPSYGLLCIALILKYGLNIKGIEEELLNKVEQDLTNEIFNYIQLNDLLNGPDFEEYFQYYKTIDFIYDFSQKPILTSKIYEELQKYKNCKALTIDFYEGFGYDI